MRYRNISVDRFEIVKFFSYTSVIMSSDDTNIDIDDWRERDHTNVKTAFDLFFKELKEKAAKLFKEATGKNAFNRCLIVLIYYCTLCSCIEFHSCFKRQLIFRNKTYR